MARPENIVTAQIREFLRLFKVPHFKHWGGPLSEKGVPDLIGTLPGPSGRGRGLWIEVKAPGCKPNANQQSFLAIHRDCGAVAFWADSPGLALYELASAGFEPAVMLLQQNPQLGRYRHGPDQQG